MHYYHGTSTSLNIKDKILPPIETGNLREEWRGKHTNKVFFTPSLMSARKFAKKATIKYGGESIVYEVEPIGDIWHVNTNEYVADSAEIISIVPQVNRKGA